MSRNDSAEILAALLDCYRTEAQPISIGYFEHGDFAGVPQITVGTTVCALLPQRYVDMSPVTVANTAVAQGINAGKPSIEIVHEALAKFPAWCFGDCDWDGNHGENCDCGAPEGD